MKILLLSNSPTDFQAYERSLTSKVHYEIKKEFETVHVFYLFKNKSYNSENNLRIFEIPFLWKGFIRKIINTLFIFFNNVKIIHRTDADLIWIPMNSGIRPFISFLLPLFFPQKKFYVQLFTPDVNNSKIKRSLNDFIVRLALKPFKAIGFSHISCKNAYKIPDKKSYYYLIGCPDYTFTIRDFNNLSIIYLGTLTNRDIWKTILGFKIFLDKYPDSNISYDIIGGGKTEDILLVNKAIQNNSLNNYVHYHGYQPTKIVIDYLNKCNLGVAFLPIVEYYDELPTTKALEYLLAGMPVIATKTQFLKDILQKDAGVLCDDTPQDFARALEDTFNNRNKFNSEKIRELYKHYSMSEVLRKEYIPMLRSLANSIK